MQTYEILVRERKVVPNSSDMTIVRTSVGIDRVHVLFDNEEWLGFPVTITFANGDVIRTKSVTLASIDGSDEWAAHATSDVPWEVAETVGPIRVTLQGTDAEGHHIITAKGSPLSVEEAGDVQDGAHPSEPTADQWQQAYANAMAATNGVASLTETFWDRLEDLVAEARDSIGSIGPATGSELGTVMVGDGLSITDDGVLSATGGSGSDESLRELAEIVLDEPFRSGGPNDDAKVRPSALPVATADTLGAVYPDGTTVTVDEDGMLHAEDAYVPTATEETLGIVKPDGTTITVDGDGTIRSTATHEPMDRESIVRLTPFGDIIPTGDGRQY